MKTKLIASIFVTASFGSSTVMAQHHNIPKAISSSFSKKYPDAVNTVWTDESAGYKVTFEHHEKIYRVNYAKNNDWVNTERVIKREYLPTQVSKSFLKSSYAKWEIRDVSIFETPEIKTQYKITVTKNNSDRKNLLFDIKGKLLKDNFIY